MQARIPSSRPYTNPSCKIRFANFDFRRLDFQTRSTFQLPFVCEIFSNSLPTPYPCDASTRFVEIWIGIAQCGVPVGQGCAQRIFPFDKSCPSTCERVKITACFEPQRSITVGELKPTESSPPPQTKFPVAA